MRENDCINRRKNIQINISEDQSSVGKAMSPVSKRSTSRNSKNSSRYLKCPQD